MTAQAKAAFSPIVFKFDSIHLRVVVDDARREWFSAAEVCAVLGYSKPRKTVAKHCREGGVTKRDTPTSSGIQSMTYIDEGNLYRLIIKSRKPQAQAFEGYLTEVMLPIIRRTGGYQAPPPAAGGGAKRLPASALKRGASPELSAMPLYEKLLEQRDLMAAAVHALERKPGRAFLVTA